MAFSFSMHVDRWLRAAREGRLGNELPPTSLYHHHSHNKGRAYLRRFANRIRLGHELPEEKIHGGYTYLMHPFACDQRQLMASGQQAISPKCHGVLKPLAPAVQRPRKV
jgi:hypothetical protein